MKKETIKDPLSSRQTDFFHWRGLSIQQDNSVFKIGTDSVLLASWIPRVLDNIDNALDVGTGTGILAMALASHYPSARIDAIDIDETAVELARTNFSGLNAKNKMNVWLEDLFHPVQEVRKYNSVICNPPYFHRQLQNGNNRLLHAKHTNLPVIAWMERLLMRLDQHGHLFIVVPFDVSVEWIKTANNQGLFCQHRLNVFSFEKDEFPVRSLLHFSDQLVKSDLRMICMYDDQEKFTGEYLAYSGINSAKF